MPAGREGEGSHRMLVGGESGSVVSFPAGHGGGRTG